MRARGLVVPTVLALVACDPEIASDRGDWTLAFPDLVRHPLGWPAPHLVAAGTRLCPVLSCKTCPEGQVCDDAPIAATGLLTPIGDGCYRADLPGDVTWTVGAPCVAEGMEPDTAAMRVVALADLAARARRGDDLLVESYVASDLLTAEGPWQPDPPAPRRVVAGAQVSFFVDLYEAATDLSVLRDRGDVAWTTDAGRDPVAYPGAAVELVAFAGTAATPRLDLDDRTWPLEPVLGVDSAEATALELATAALDGAPVLARAIARDGAGRPLHGAPVTWSVDDHALALHPRAANPDVLDLSDECRAPEARGGPREATLRARWRGLEATRTLRWTGEADPADPNWQPHDSCTDGGGGCGGCGVDPGGDLLALAALLLLLPRRRRARVTHVPRTLALGTCLILPATACSDPPALAPTATRELGALAWDPRISGRDGGYSARVGDRVLFVFGDTTAEKAPDALPGFLNNTACSTVDLDASDGLFPLVEHLEERGYPHEFLPLTDTELAYEHQHNGPDCGASCEGIALWPGPVIPDPARGRVLVFYAKLLQRPGALDVTVLGTSIAAWDADLPTQAKRPIVRPDSHEPTLLFQDGDPEFAAAALAEGDDLLAFTCEGDGFDKPCRLARAPLADALTREAWRFYAGDGAWSRAAGEAEALFQGAPMMTVHRHPASGQYVAVYAEPASTRIVLRTAPAPEGPWSDAAELHRPRTPLAATTIYGALLHPELARDGGATDYLTYYLGETGTIQLVEISWPN